jgi:hypothetical protein
MTAGQCGNSAGHQSSGAASTARSTFHHPRAWDDRPHVMRPFAVVPMMAHVDAEALPSSSHGRASDSRNVTAGGSNWHVAAA